MESYFSLPSKMWTFFTAQVSFGGDGWEDDGGDYEGYGNNVACCDKQPRSDVDVDILRYSNSVLINILFRFALLMICLHFGK